MSEEGTYLVLKQYGTALVKSRGSKFYGYCYPVHSEVEAKEYITKLKTEFPDATHHCFAWIIGAEKQFQRAYDDGEPANSAGKPILRELLRLNLTDALVVVVRYYGGTNLGVPGLIENYGLSAAEALAAGGISEKQEEVILHLSCSFANEQMVYRMQKHFGFTILNRNAAEDVHFTVAVRKNIVEEFLKEVSDTSLITMHSKD